MRRTLVLATILAVATAPLPIAAQQADQPASPQAKSAEPSAEAKAPSKKARAARARGRGSESISRSSYDPDICGVINGWRAFPTRDARGYFNTGRVCCCR